MEAFNCISTNLTRYMFQFLEPEEIITIGFMNKRLRNIFNLRREFIMPFLFTSNIDYKRKFLQQINQHMNYIEKKFPKLEEAMLFDFLAFYIKFSNASNKTILFPSACNEKDAKLIINSLYSEHSGAHNEKIICKLGKILEDELKNNNCDLSGIFPKIKDVSTYPTSVNTIEMSDDEINNLKNFSMLNKNYFTKFTCRYNDENKQILNEFLHDNPNVKSSLVITDFDFNFYLHDIHKFNRVLLDFFTYNDKEVPLEILKKFILHFKNFKGKFDLKLRLEYNENLKEIFELLTANLTNIVTLEIIIKNSTDFRNFDFALFANSNINLRSVHLGMEGENAKEYVLRIGKLGFELPSTDSSFLFEAMCMIERNLVKNENYFKDFDLVGNAKFLIEFCNFMAERLTNKNFRKLFSKIKKLEILKGYSNEHAFNLRNSTKDNIEKCFKHMVNIKSLKIDFYPGLEKYIHLFQFNLLTSLNTFKYRSSKNIYVDESLAILVLIKDIKIKYLRVYSLREYKEFEEITKNLKQIFKLKVDLKDYYPRLFEEGLIKLIEKSQHLSEFSIAYSIDENRKIFEELQKKFANITFIIKPKFELKK